MENLLFILIAVLLTGSIAKSNGFDQAHAEIARECEVQGSFYVDDKVFECKPKPKTK